MFDPELTQGLMAEGRPEGSGERKGEAKNIVPIARLFPTPFFLLTLDLKLSLNLNLSPPTSQS